MPAPVCFNFEMKNESQSPTQNSENNNIIIYARSRQAVIIIVLLWFRKIGQYYCISTKYAMQNAHVPTADDIRLGWPPNRMQY